MCLGCYFYNDFFLIYRIFRVGELLYYLKVLSGVEYIIKRGNWDRIV